MRTVSKWTAAAILSVLMIGTAFGQESEDSWIEVEADVVGVLQRASGFSGYFVNTDGGSTEASALFDIGLTARPLESVAAYVRFKTGLGDGIDAVIPSFSLFNTAAIGNDARLDELWYEHAFGEKVRLRGGKLDLTMAFDTNAVANNEYDQFLSGGFVNNLAVEFPYDTGLGAMLWISPNTFFDIGVAFADAGGGWDDVFDSFFTIVELGMKPEIAGRQGNYRVYGWHNGSDHLNLSSYSADFEANYGFGLSVDQEIADGVTLFARYGRGRGGVSPIEQAWSAGLGISGKFLGREDDTIGLAYGQAIMGKDWKIQIPTIPGSDFVLDVGGNEHRMEIYYNIKANNLLNVSPHFKWTKNPIGDNGDGGAWAFGVRAHINLGRGW